MKIVIAALGLGLITSAFCQANCGNGNGNGNGCSGSQIGPQGPKGDKGDPGKAGEKGDKGFDGKNGRDAAPAADNMERRLTTNLGLEIRWYDWKHVALASGYRYDANHRGHTVDALVLQIKIGKSHADRQIARLQRQIDLLLWSFDQYEARKKGNQNER